MDRARGAGSGGSDAGPSGASTGPRPTGAGAPGPRSAGRDRVGQEAPVDPATTVARAAADDVPLRRAGRAVRTRWGRASGRTRVAAALLATAVASAFVVTAGTAALPDYGGAGPVAGGAVDDLRHEPVAASWSLDPVADLGLDARETCVDHEVVGTVGDDVLLSVSLTGRQVFGSPSCPNESPRLVRLDPATGAVAWVLDPAAVLGVDQGNGAEGLVTVWFDDADQVLTGVAATGPTARASGTSVVVEVTGAAAAAHARLDLGTGEVHDVQRSGGQGRSRVVSTVGPLALVADAAPAGTTDSRADAAPDDTGTVPDDSWTGTDGGTATDAAGTDGAAAAARDALAPDAVTRTRWSLLRVDDLGDPIWTGTTEDDATPLLLADRLVLPGDDAALVVDAATGGASTWRGALPTSALPFTVDGRAYAASALGGTAAGEAGGRLTAYAPDGRVRWTRDYVGERFPVLSGSCVLLTAGGAGVRCVDVDTGEQRWERPDDGAPFLSARPAPPGTTTGDVWVEVARRAPGAGGDEARTAWTRTVLALDEATGAERFRAAVPRESRLRAASRTVGYAFSARSQTGRETSVTAFDLADGHALWELTRDDGDLQFWGGSLVRVDPDGTAHRLVDPVRVAG
ncbi:outer membrane protein assembly factor BamB family protein [Frigoribacterium salinisoli]